MGEERTAQEVLDDHLSMSLSGDVEDDIERNYAHDVTIISNWGIERGHAGVRRMAQLLESQLPEYSFSYTMRLVEGELGMLEWSATPTAGSVDDGVDSYVIRDGRIQGQTIHYTLTPM
jgi:hypothetical protein